jgi:hypothetical protein
MFGMELKLQPFPISLPLHYPAATEQKTSGCYLSFKISVVPTHDFHILSVFSFESRSFAFLKASAIGELVLVSVSLWVNLFRMLLPSPEKQQSPFSVQI